MNAGTRERMAGWLPPLALFVVVLAVWEGASILLGIKSFLLPRPSLIAGQLVSLWPATLSRGVFFTAMEALSGLLVGVTAGTIIGLAAARWVTARETLMPIAIGASTVPIIAFAPIAINWFGPESMLPRTIIVALMVFFPVHGEHDARADQVEPAALELLTSYAATDWQTLAKLRVPNALPYWFTALRIATTLRSSAPSSASSSAGRCTRSGSTSPTGPGSSDYPTAWAAIVLACALGIVFYLAAVGLERIVMPWQARREMGR